MTTRQEDALNVLGTENKSIVEEIEQEFQSKVNKSEVAELIVRSVDEAEQIKSENDYSKLTTLSKDELVGLIVKMTDDGEIEDTTLTNRLSEFTEKAGKKCKTCGEEMDEDETGEVCKSCKNKMKKSETENIPEVTEKKSEANYVTVEHLESVVNSALENLLNKMTEQKQEQTATEIVSEKVVEIKEEVPAWKSLVSNFEAGLAVAVSKSGNDRLASFQEVISKTAEEMKSYHNKLAETEPQVKEEINIDTLKSMVNDAVSNAVAVQVGEVKQDISSLNNAVQSLINNLQNKSNVKPQQLPVSKGIVQSPQLQINRSDSNRPMSPLEIAKRSALGH